MSWFYASSLYAFAVLLLSVAHLSHVGGFDHAEDVHSLEPWFSEPIPNVTVAEGRPATLPCTVENLGNYRLAWIHKDRHNLLTLQDRVITPNARVSIRTDPPRRTWWLRIDDVRLEDRGVYMCQVNTGPMISQTGHIQVVVPPSIDEEWTSSDVEIREGSDVRLKCRATGSPEPEIHWRREHDRHIIVSPNERVSNVYGERLNLRRTSRLSMGAYLCIASNGIQPSVSKRIMLNVLFPPMILIPSQLIGASIGEEVTLICNLESNPRSITYWLLSGGILIMSNNKYKISQRSDPSPRAFPYKIELQLKILDLRPPDFGSYTCVAKNSLGETEGVISLYEKPDSHRQIVNQAYPQGGLLTKKERILGFNATSPSLKEDLISRRTEDSDGRSKSSRTDEISSGRKGNLVSGSDGLSFRVLYYVHITVLLLIIVMHFYIVGH